MRHITYLRGMPHVFFIYETYKPVYQHITNGVSKAILLHLKSYCFALQKDNFRKTKQQLLNFISKTPMKRQGKVLYMTTV